MVVVDLLVKVLAAVRVRPVAQANERLKPVASPPPVDQRAADDARAEAHARSLSARLEAESRVTAPAESRLDTVDGKLIASLLEDPQLAEEARIWMKRGYGRDVVAGILTRKASELGLGDVEITADDIPEGFRK